MPSTCMQLCTVVQHWSKLPCVSCFTTCCPCMPICNGIHMLSWMHAVLGALWALGACRLPCMWLPAACRPQAVPHMQAVDQPLSNLLSFASTICHHLQCPPPCRYLPVLQFVTLLTTPATALYAIGGLLASPLVIPAIIIKNLVVLVRQQTALVAVISLSLLPRAWQCQAVTCICECLACTSDSSWPMCDMACSWYTHGMRNIMFQVSSSVSVLLSNLSETAECIPPSTPRPPPPRPYLPPSCC